MPDPALAEIAALRERLARLEATAAAAAGPTPLRDAVGGHYSSTTPPPDAAARRLAAEARQFIPNDGMEAALTARAKDSAAYDAEVRRVGGGNGLERALYERGRDAAIKAGTFVPADTKETP